MRRITAVLIGFVLCAVGQMDSTAAALRPTWLLAHRSNDEGDIKAAADKGANGVEFDVMSVDQSFEVHHPGPDTHIPTLTAWAAALVAERNRIFLAYLDYKGPDFTSAARERLIAQLRTAGVASSGIHVLLSTSSLQNSSFFQGFHGEAWIAPQFDEDNAPTAVVQFFTGAHIAPIWFSDGITELLPEPPHVKANLTAAIELRNAGPPIKGVAIWTLDKQSSMRDYLRLGVDAILTNDADDAISVLNEPEFAKTRRLATKSDLPW